MTQIGKLLLGGGTILIALGFAMGKIRVHYTTADQPSPYGLSPMAERLGETWQLEDGSSLQIARTYFTAAGEEATFHVEWEVPDDQVPPSHSREAMLELTRPVLRHAFAKGELGRAEIYELPVGSVRVSRMRAVVRASGGLEKRELVVSDMDEVFVWNWTFDGRAYRIFAPGYYTDVDSGRVTFTIKWHDPTLCHHLKGIDDEAAFALAKPVLLRAAAWHLWQFVPRVSPDGILPPLENPDGVGLELGCPEENCEFGAPCRVSGYRVTRGVDVLMQRNE